MQIVVEGNIVKGARITGPQHHFLEVVFCARKSQDKSKVDFIDYANEPSNKHETLLQCIISDFSEVIGAVSYDSKDALNKVAYEELFYEIVDNYLLCRKN